ncbi:cytochrome c peroxidase [Microbulbifer sp. JTAC008]|uniref:cytochrome c peroxidase n=1 Tax=unclassified Microbulbifer TaxID=2619833 RepID=UPI0040398E05
MNLFFKKYLKLLLSVNTRILAVFAVLLLWGCGGGGSSGSSGGDDSSGSSGGQVSTDLESPSNLVAVTTSASTIRISWEPNESGDVSYLIYRDGEEIAETQAERFEDSGLSSGTKYSYSAAVKVSDGSYSEPSNEDIARTLDSDRDDDWYNGTSVDTTFAEVNTTIARLDECTAGERVSDVWDIATENLNECLRAAAEVISLGDRVGALRAYVARLRREEDPALIELGMRLFHSKSLSLNNDSSCSSCHHPTLGCGSDGLSLPIGVNTVNPDLLGPGRSDGNLMPLLPRNSPPTCNSAIWSDSLFWDRRVSFRTGINNIEDKATYLANQVRTDDGDVSDDVNSFSEEIASNSLTLLMAQAHFPVVTAEEMGERGSFASDSDYRENIASGLSDEWDSLFEDAFGDSEKTFLRVSEALAAYQASQLFIDNPFFDFLDGNDDAMTEMQKRGGILFYTNTACAQCHDGPFFTLETSRGFRYPQIGVGTNEDGSDLERYRVPSLLNVSISGPWGHAGQFGSLERNISHYFNTVDSIQSYFGVDDTGTPLTDTVADLCELEQFEYLGSGCVDIVAPNGYQLTMDLVGDSPANRGESDDEIEILAEFLRALTDPSALPGTPEIDVLIPPRDGGPDGRQLDAVDQEGNSL